MTFDLNFQTLAIVAGCSIIQSIILILFGYGLGRNSAGLPLREMDLYEKEDKKIDQGSTDEPEGDIINDAFEYEPENVEVRIATLPEELDKRI